MKKLKSSTALLFPAIFIFLGGLITLRYAMFDPEFEFSVFLYFFGIPWSYLPIPGTWFGSSPVIFFSFCVLMNIFLLGCLGRIFARRPSVVKSGPITFLVEVVFEITGRGAFVMGDIQSGILKPGLVHVRSGLKIGGIEFARRSTEKADGIILWFENNPPKEKLDIEFLVGKAETFE